MLNIGFIFGFRAFECTGRSKTKILGQTGFLTLNFLFVTICPQRYCLKPYKKSCEILLKYLSRLFNLHLVVFAPFLPQDQFYDPKCVTFAESTGDFSQKSFSHRFSSHLEFLRIYLKR